MENTTNCSRCSRNCIIRLVAEKDKHYLGGNKCVGGELTAREYWPQLDGQPLKELDSLKKPNFVKRLLSGLSGIKCR